MTFGRYASSSLGGAANCGFGIPRKVSVVIPALNEGQGIGKTISAIPREAIQMMGYDVQVLVVDGGSTDETVKVAMDAGAEVIEEPRLGYGRAYKTGFANAEGDILVTADADATYPVEDIPQLLKTLEDGQCDFITTNRYAFMEKGAMSMMHRLGNGVLSLSARMLFHMDVRDSQSGMWVFRKSLLDHMVLRSDSMAFSEELKVEACHFADCSWKEVPIAYKTRVGEVKLQSWRHGSENLLFLFRKRIAR